MFKSQFMAYRAMSASLVNRLRKISILLLQTLFNFSLDLWLFGIVLSSSIKSSPMGTGFADIVKFTLPGVLLLVLANNLVTDSSFNIFYSRFNRSISAILASPISNLSIVMSYLTSGLLRVVFLTICGLIIGNLIAGVTVLYPLQFCIFIMILTTIFSSIGIVEGVTAQSFYQAGFLTRLVLQTLWYFSGAIYDVSTAIPSSISFLVKFNPIFYIINMMRYYLNGSSNYIPGPYALPILGVAGFILVAFSTFLFSTHKNIRS